MCTHWYWIFPWIHKLSCLNVEKMWQKIWKFAEIHNFLRLCKDLYFSIWSEFTRVQEKVKSREDSPLENLQLNIRDRYHVQLKVNESREVIKCIYFLFFYIHLMELWYHLCKSLELNSYFEGWGKSKICCSCSVSAALRHE